MEREIICPACNTAFEAEEFVDGQCPSCQKKYTWDFDCDDADDAVLLPEWENNEEIIIGK